MRLTRSLLLFLGLSLTVCQAQDIEKQKAELKLFEEEKRTGEFASLQKKYAGKVGFTDAVTNKEMPGSSCTSSYTFGDKLSFSAFFSHSVLSSMLLQMMCKGSKAKDLNNSGTWFPKYLAALYVDGNRIITGCAISVGGKETHSDLSQRGTLYDDQSDLDFRKTLYKDLKTRAGLLKPGKHMLKIEYVPYFNFGTATDVEFKPVASGEIWRIVKNRNLV